MENSLLSYMNKRFEEASNPKAKPTTNAGPVITISRQAGCGGLHIAQMLAESMDDFGLCKEWQVISKEILQKSAQELKLSLNKVDRLFTTKEHNTFDEVLEAFNTKMYKSNRVILKTVKEVIKGFAVDGCCIILGRGGEFITRDIEQSLHIRLEAPLKWRVDKIAAKRAISHDEANKQIAETEKKREVYRKHYLNKNHPVENYDLTINVSAFTPSNVVELIKRSVELKGMMGNTPLTPQ
ncbi:cytidylate kinase-like family protein [uncultured Sunxiuqinia sp.]|uniref:cytidylate kinase-like family protein n=1 Tax=uncultured Sunxiuqinia sp. TaxID=1573825 RepID=UPI002AA60B7E|nr:cytidylate kinase-like family protein [uncultured Sunxiuqinia sp.]